MLNEQSKQADDVEDNNQCPPLTSLAENNKAGGESQSCVSTEAQDNSSEDDTTNSSPLRASRIFVNEGHHLFGAFKKLCHRTKALYNCCIYVSRYMYFHKVNNNKGFVNPLFDKMTFDKMPWQYSRKDFEHIIKELYPDQYKAMPSAASAQRVVQRALRNFKDYNAASKAYKENPSKFTGKPRLPNYVRSPSSTFIVEYNGFSVVNGVLTISGGESFGFSPTYIGFSQNQRVNPKNDSRIVKEIRIVPQGHSFVLEAVYDINLVDLEYGGKVERCVELDSDRFMSMDLGVEILVAAVTNIEGEAPILLKGDNLSRIIQNYWKNISSFDSHHAKHKHKSRWRGPREQRSKIVNKYKRKKNDFLHKASRALVNYALAHRISRIIIGYNPLWKQCVNLGSANNQKFVSIPHLDLIHKIEYKAAEYGIKVIVREESYTSRASALDLDPIPVYNPHLKTEKIVFSGKRISRSLYKSKQGIIIHADVNGAINIARKELGDGWLLSSDLLTGCLVSTPVVLDY